MPVLLAQDTLLSPLVPRSQWTAHTPALLASREGQECRIAVKTLSTSSFLPLKHLGSSVPGQVTAFTNSLWLCGLITVTEASQYLWVLTAALTQHPCPCSTPRSSKAGELCLGQWAQLPAEMLLQTLQAQHRHSGHVRPSYNKPVLISLPGNTSRVGFVLFSLFFSQ